MADTIIVSIGARRFAVTPEEADFVASCLAVGNEDPDSAGLCELADQIEYAFRAVAKAGGVDTGGHPTEPMSHAPKLYEDRTALRERIHQAHGVSLAALKD